MRPRYMAGDTCQGDRDHDRGLGIHESSLGETRPTWREHSGTLSESTSSIVAIPASIASAHSMRLLEFGVVRRVDGVAVGGVELDLADEFVRLAIGSLTPDLE